MKIRSKLKFIVLCMIFLICVTGCSNTGKSVSTIDFSDEIDRIQEKEKAKVEKNKMDNKEYFDKKYSDLYFNDYTEERAYYNQAFREYIISQITNIEEHHYALESKIELLPEYYEKSKDKKIEIKELLKHADEYLVNVEITAHDDYSDENYGYKNDITNFAQLFSYIGHLFEERNFDEYYLKMYKYALEENQENIYSKAIKNDDIFNTLLGYDRDIKFGLDIYRGFKSTGPDYEQWAEEDEILESRYGEEFVLVDEMENAALVFSPVRNLDIKFEIRYSLEYEDLYHGAVAQYEMGKLVNRYIEEVGLEGNIGHFTGIKRYSNGFDDDIAGVSDYEAYFKGYDILEMHTNLYYLKTSNEEIDYEALKVLCEKIRGLGVELFHQELYVFFYEMDENKKKISAELFKKQIMTDHKFTYESGGGILSGMHVTRAETEVFEFLDTYGMKEDYMLNVIEVFKNDKSGKEFFELYKNKNLWED